VRPDTLFFTGMQRSGTTLLEKLVAGDPRYSLLSQPFPLLFVEVKQAFLRSLGSEDPYPLGHLFLESRYPSGAFSAFLANWRTSPAQLEAVFQRMADYSGQYTRFPPGRVVHALSALPPDSDFASVISELDCRLAPSDEAAWYGSKETICEEFVPYLLECGFRCVVIIRDPRDVLASLNHGRGQDFGGDLKPTLFNVRNWRKSVAVALAMADHPLFLSCRYEDLVSDPVNELGRLSKKLDIPPIDDPRQPREIRDSDGSVWRGNSSHGEHDGVSQSSVGVYRRVLPPSVAAFVEATCLPELQALEYDTTMTRSEARHVLEAFREPYTVTRTGLQNDRATAQNASVETTRMDIVADRPGADSPFWFIFERAHARLREAFRP